MPYDTTPPATASAATRSSEAVDWQPTAAHAQSAADVLSQLGTDVKSGLTNTRQCLRLALPSAIGMALSR